MEGALSQQTHFYFRSYTLHVFLLNFTSLLFFFSLFFFNAGPGTTEETPKCIFPFTYNGKSYNSCTTDGREDDKLWCAITKNYDVDKRLAFCTITSKRMKGNSEEKQLFWLTDWLSLMRILSSYSLKNIGNWFWMV